MAEYKLKTPLNETLVRKLKVNDSVKISGSMFTARDLAHRYLLEETSQKELPINLKNSVIYHCGPIMLKKGKNYEVISAGPTTSSRMNMHAPGVIGKYKIRAIIGKGGMGPATVNALKKSGAVYLSAVGAALLAKYVKQVKGVYLLNRFGMPDAIWELEIENFPAIVTMDSKGNSLYQTILGSSREKYNKLI